MSFRKFESVIEAGEAGTGPVEMPGNYLRVWESDWPLEIKFDDGDWIPFDVGASAGAKVGSLFRFSRFELRHKGPNAGAVQIIVGDGVEVSDGRLTISEARNGSAASYIPPVAAEVVSTASGGVAVDAWIPLLPYDANREEVWLHTDAATSAFWSLSAGATENPARNIKKDVTAAGWLKLRTKAAIYVMHKEAGKSVTAITFSY